MNKFAVSIVDDHALFRRGVADIIRQSADFQVQKEYSSGLDFLNELPHADIDVLLLDVQMPEITGIEVLKQIREKQAHFKVIILTASLEDSIVLDAIRYGANGFLPKDTLPEDILLKLQQVMQGEIVLHANGIHVLAEQFRHSAPLTVVQPLDKTVLETQRKLLLEMTQREQETLRLIAKGLNNKLIARELGISDGTVKVYVKNLLRKLSVHSRLELSVWVHQHLNSSDFEIHSIERHF
ncbi:response regulator [Acinetobacter sp. YH12063]|uniref:response regulator n=1 Tax=Acinetobacter sp. YH12063 TaxID=2601061 RepID=UPI0015D1BC3D|nr:response regulator [Acinetobacter sp. YH12063]